MESIILWKGRYYQSMEICKVISSDSNHDIRSTIIGVHDERIYHVDYHIRTNSNWQTSFAEIITNTGGKTIYRVLENKKDGWYLDNRQTNIFGNADFIDISVTPFTNTLPVRGLELTKAPRTIDVIYFDVLADDVSLVQQVYKRVGDKKYLFATKDGSFHAALHVDPDGYVTDYPTLFKMIARQNIPAKNT